MAGPEFTKENSQETAGVIVHLRFLRSSFIGHFQTRIQLAGLESREAAVHLVKLLLWIGLGIALMAFGYLFLCGALVFICSLVFGVPWIWILFGLSLAHFGGAIACIKIVQKKLPQPLFESTFNEFKKDQEWLTSHSKQN